MMEYTIALGEGVVPLNIFNLYLIGAVFMYVLAFSFNCWKMRQYPKLGGLGYAALTALLPAMMWPFSVASLALYGVLMVLPSVRRSHREGRVIRDAAMEAFR